MILKQVKAIFVDFSKMTLRKAKIIFEKFAIFSTSKKLIFMCLHKKKVDAIWKNGNMLEGVPCDEF